MAATVTNKAVNTGSVTNKEFSQKSAQWVDQNYDWASAEGTWDAPYGITNKAVNTASVTNKALS